MDGLEAVLVLLLSLAEQRLRPLRDIDETDALRALVVALEGVDGLVGRGLVVGRAADEAAEEGGDDRLGDDDLVVGAPTLEVQKLDADGLRGEHLLEVIRVHAVS